MLISVNPKNNVYTKFNKCIYNVCNKTHKFMAIPREVSEMKIDLEKSDNPVETYENTHRMLKLKHFNVNTHGSALLNCRRWYSPIPKKLVRNIYPQISGASAGGFSTLRTRCVSDCVCHCSSRCCS